MGVDPNTRLTPPEPLELLGQGVPLSLLLDLAGLCQNASTEIYRQEGGQADWLTPRLCPVSS
ncbi:MAG: hypothetical protein ACYCO3_00940 [Mycobacteriales bacterium]